VAKHTPSGWDLLDGWADSEYVSTGQASNHLMVVRYENDISVYANGGHIATVSDASLGSGRLGLVAQSFDDPNADLRFDSFRAYSLGEFQMSGE